MQKMIQLNVTKLDIQRGSTSSCGCPVARALRRKLKLKNKNRINVQSYGVRIYNNKTQTCTRFNDNTSKHKTQLHRFVCDFDAGRKVEPVKLFLVQAK